jgi:hypothetical protein
MQRRARAHTVQLLRHPINGCAVGCAVGWDVRLPPARATDWEVKVAYGKYLAQKQNSLNCNRQSNERSIAIKKKYKIKKENDYLTCNASA